MAKKGKKKAISQKTWKQLYDLAKEIKEMAPWDWISESEFFGVQDPNTGELGFVSIMGMNGEHFAIATYRGAEGLYGYWHMANTGPMGNPEEILEVPQLQLSFEDRNTLTANDREIIKELGMKFRGRSSWPMFRSFRPGYYPWYLKKKEAEFLIHILEQCQNVLPRYEADETLLDPITDETYLVRVAEESENGFEWRDEFMEIIPPNEDAVEITIDGPIMETFLNLEQAVKAVDADVFMFPGQIQEKRGKRPYFAYMLMIVEPETGMVFGTELLSPFPSLEAMWGKVPETIFKAMSNIGIYPNEIRTSSPRLHMVLEPVAEDIGFSVKHVQSLPALEEAKGFIMSRFF
jgi:hypothetical protein